MGGASGLVGGGIVGSIGGGICGSAGGGMSGIFGTEESSITLSFLGYRCWAIDFAARAASCRDMCLEVDWFPFKKPYWQTLEEKLAA